MINKSIKFLALLFLTFNVFAGGDDRDQVYYENLDEELAAFEAQLAEDLAKAEIDAFKAEMDAALAEQKIEDELAAFEAKLEAELAAQEMMAEIEAEMARAAALAAFQQKLEDERAAAAKSTAAYQSKLAREAEITARMKQLAIEQELALFESKLEAELAAQEMMAEIEEEMARAAALAAFIQKLEDERAAAALSTAAYEAKVAYEKRVLKILEDLMIELEKFNLLGEYKSSIYDQLIAESMSKLEDEGFVGTISGEIVTEAIHEYCKVNLGLSESNIKLFKKALEGGYLGNVGPQVTNGTEFELDRWQKYLNCVGSQQ